MLAVRKIGRGIGNIEVQEVPEPQSGPEQVVVQVDSAGICGTDLQRVVKSLHSGSKLLVAHSLPARRHAGIFLPKSRVSPTKVRKVPQDSCQLPGRKGFSAIPELPRPDLF